jgi:hypothetical protein
MERSTEYFALSIGCRARRTFLTAFGVTARFTARPGCMARRTPRGTRSRVKKPMTNPPARNAFALILRPELARQQCLQRTAANTPRLAVTLGPLLGLSNDLHAQLLVDRHSLGLVG